MRKLQSIQIRDPFIVPVAEEGRYYLFGTTDKDCWGKTAEGFQCYRSADLVNWEGPMMAFSKSKDFWGKYNFWAPEVHRYRGRYYMFASFKSDDACRATQILASDVPQGPYTPHSDGPVTPYKWECLDGTLYVDDAGVPWMVFCHEWLQIQDGGMCAVRLSEDLRGPVGEPVTLFHASQATWVTDRHSKKNHVTDGPFLHRAANGALLMLWSTGMAGSYAIGVARSKSGSLLGPWDHDHPPLFTSDGGHGMLFRTFAGQLHLTIHTPNDTPNERPVIFPIDERDGELQVRQAL